MDKHIKQIRIRFGFDVRRSGSRRGKYTPPPNMPEIFFVVEKVEQVPPLVVSHLLNLPQVLPLPQQVRAQKPLTLWSKPLECVLSQTLTALRKIGDNCRLSQRSSPRLQQKALKIQKESKNGTRICKYGHMRF